MFDFMYCFFSGYGKSPLQLLTPSSVVGSFQYFFESRTIFSE